MATTSPLSVLVMPGAPALTAFRDPGGAESLHVAVDRAERNLELVGQRGCRRPSPGLEDEKQRQQPVGLHGDKYSSKP